MNKLQHSMRGMLCTLLCLLSFYGSQARHNTALAIAATVGSAINLTDIEKPVVAPFFKNADEFAATFDRNGALSSEQRQTAFDLYNQQKWNELEALFKSNSWNGGWPPANGGYNIIDDVPLKAGMKFDRYSAAVGNYTGEGTPNLGGSFTSPLLNGQSYTFTQRALNQAEHTYDFYYEIEVLKDLPFKGQIADIIPWFGQAGNGKQTMWKIPVDPASGYPKTWNQLAKEGYIKVIIKQSPSGKYPNIAGTIIP
ncbi:glycohydrolase toxin TNT-related protein [Edaphocola aurantiacus]|uniref:glycohydrolase toxin TNT-related protein n=1 Tax=Edaphocola aurantiacus TaxID=2601682 RepID=UPI001C946C64|nr:glycohydrolase toxin TNT-related protein [Edaphocola aurantiacus]